MSGYESVHIESRDVGEMAREEVAAAKASGVDPLDLARTHEKVAAAIRNIVHWQQAADGPARVRHAVESQRSRLAAPSDPKEEQNNG